LDAVRDAFVFRLIERISEHYRANIANRFIRPALLQLALDRLTWDQIEVFTEKYEQFRYQGFQLDELYRQLVALARFIVAARREVVPSLRHRLDNSVSSGDRVLRDMAINNFAANLQIVADLTYELYGKLVEIDNADTAGRRPLCQQTPEFAGIGDLLLHG
jgi:hypothetical protein